MQLRLTNKQTDVALEKVASSCMFQGHIQLDRPSVSETCMVPLSVEASHACSIPAIWEE